jgi:hypothetical protein
MIFPNALLVNERVKCLLHFLSAGVQLVQKEAKGASVHDLGRRTAVDADLLDLGPGNSSTSALVWTRDAARARA